jgi:hypothetical protein
MRGILTFVVFCAAGVAVAEGEKERPEENRRRTAAPQPIFKVTVQEKPHFKDVGVERPRASEPSSSERLSVVLRPERSEFPLEGPLSFEVTLKNVADEALRLARPDLLGGEFQLVIANRKTAAQWAAKLPEGAKSKKASVTLDPGESVRYTLLVAVPDQHIPAPGPIPLPRPIPLPEAKDEIAPRRPIARPFPITGRLPCGIGSFRTQLFLEFAEPAKKDDDAEKLWTGRLASGTVDFEVAAAAAVQPGFRIPAERD